MCNAWNHPPGCTCGWGGDGHLGFGHNKIVLQPSYGDTLKFLSLWTDKNSYSSYVNPNAICPVCGRRVFFYQSQVGGRVYFDELGPPWPKHPCTDSGLLPSAYKVMRVDFVPAWVGHDWCPAVIRKIKKIQSGSIISFKKLTKEGNEFLKDYFLPEGPINISDTLIFYRDVDDNFFEFIQYQLESDIMVKQLGFKEQKVLENPLIAENIELIQKGKRFKAQYRGNKHGQYHVVHLLGIEEPKVCLVESFSGKSSNKMIHLDVEKFELDVEVKYVTPNAIYFKEV